MARYGTTAEQLASVAVTFRAHAAANPHARLRTPITVDDVLASPMIASPLHKLDCCVVTDGGGAVVMTSAERAGFAPQAGAAVRFRRGDGAHTALADRAGPLDTGDAVGAAGLRDGGPVAGRHRCRAAL